MTVKSFTPVPYGTTESISQTNLDNLTYLDISHDMGDASTITGPDDRRSLNCIYDLNQFGGIPEDALVFDARFTVIPLATISSSVSGDVDHRFALMASTGGWDRSPQSPLHQSNSGIVYGNPSRYASMEMRGENSASATVFDCITTTGAFAIQTSATRPTLASTFKLPANENLKSIELFLKRLDGVASSLISPVVYDLEGDGRHFAIKSHLKTFLPLTYSSVSVSAAWVEFAFFDSVLEATASDRWLAIVLEGAWFTSGNSKTTERLEILGVSNAFDNTYATGTEGSFFTADAQATIDNSLSNVGYSYAADLPRIYRDGITTPLTTPYQRYKGNILASDDASIAWVLGQAYNYGTESGGTVNEITGITPEIQTHLDSADYDLAGGKTFLGLIIEPNDPNDLLWEVAGINAGVIVAPVLRLSYTFYPVITSTPPEFAIEGSSFTYTVEATDLGGTGLTFSHLSIPSWLSIHPTTGVISGTPPIDSAASYLIIIQVEEGSSLALTALQTFQLKVLAVSPVPVVTGLEFCLKMHSEISLSVAVETSISKAVYRSSGIRNTVQTDLDLENC